MNKKNIKKVFNISGKKSQAEGTTAKMILLVMTAIVILAFITILIINLSGKNDIETCRISTLAQATTKLAPTLNGGESPFSINCKKRYVTFTDTEVLQGLDPDHQKTIPVMYNGRSVKKIPGLTPYVVNQVLAEEMRICDYQFGEGKLNVFNPQLWKNSDVCFVCTEATFKTKAPQTYHGFMQYLQDTSIANEGMTYYEYFNQKGLSVVDWNLTLYRFYPNGVKDINPADPQFVVYMKEGKKLEGFLISAIAGGIAGIVHGDVHVNEAKTAWDLANDKFNNYHVYLLTKDQMNQNCDIVAS